jgi:hypothetical protein
MPGADIESPFYDRFGCHMIIELGVMNMRRIICVLVFLFLISPVYAASIYKWTDEKGGVHYSDDLNKVPPAYRDRVEVEKWEDTEKTEAPPPVSLQAPPQKASEVATDIYGQDEVYWRGRVRPWKERLQEASDNYAKVQSKFTEKSEELSRRRFGSPTQYKSNIIELDRLREEMAKYQGEIAEATEMLNKISKEAEAAKANPDWLK